MIGIYKFTNKYNRKVYIGQAVNIKKRYATHVKAINSNDTMYFHTALRKYGLDGFDFSILIECPRENLNYWEKFYIKYYCSNMHKYGYNQTTGGHPTAGRTNKHKGESRPNYVKDKISKTLTGHIVTKETRIKISNGQTPEMRNASAIRMRKNMTGKEPPNKGKKLYIDENGKRHYK